MTRRLPKAPADERKTGVRSGVITMLVAAGVITAGVAGLHMAPGVTAAVELKILGIALAVGLDVLALSIAIGVNERVAAEVVHFSFER